MNPQENSKLLVVIVHGLLRSRRLSPSRYGPMKKAIKNAFPDARIELPELPFQFYSGANLNDVVNILLQRIDTAWNEITSGGTTPGRIILIGHSMGALVARKVYICACGENEDAPFESGLEKQRRPWAKDVKRLVLMAGILRGWTINPHLDLARLITFRLGMLLGFFMQIFGRTPVSYGVRRGSAFVTQVRLQWLSMVRNFAKKGVGDALVVQLLGTIDDLVSPQETVDSITGANFIYIDIPNSNHTNVLNFNEPVFGAGREEAFLRAIKEDKSILEESSITPDDENLIQPDLKVTDVVFVIHGIRDTGYWTQKLARRVKLAGNKAHCINSDGQTQRRKFAMETSTYGYFAMLPFVLYSTRRAKVEWLMDQYVENKARYPNATFSFVGHSNGTYLLAKALENYPACKFTHVVLAGSVVSSDYNWKQAITTGRVAKIFNFVATSDWIVAIFPGTFQKFYRVGVSRDGTIGGGGFDGFTHVDDVNQLLYVRGGHGAAVEEKYWDDIAHFIVNGEFSSGSKVKEGSKRPGEMALLGKLGPVVFVLIFLLVLAIGVLTTITPYWIWKSVEGCIAALIGYGLLIGYITTKF